MAVSYYNPCMKHKMIFAVAAVLLVFIITNPSEGSFREHQGKTSNAGLIREHNFFVCSIYRDQHEYLAILGNFFQLIPTYTPAPVSKLSPKPNKTKSQCDDCVDIFSTDTSHLKPHKLTAEDKKISAQIDSFIKAKKHPAAK
jgi:hypothetical protein